VPTTSAWANYPVHKGTVLYLALEDDHLRLRERLYRMFGMEGTNDLLFSICAKQVGIGLEEQLKRFAQEHPDTKLIIIDTFQKIREAGGDKYSYANDYEVAGKLKRFADAYGVCLLLAHHTRKQQADDKFDMISGANGLTGTVDGAFLIQKHYRQLKKRKRQEAINVPDFIRVCRFPLHLHSHQPDESPAELLKLTTVDRIESLFAKLDEAKEKAQAVVNGFELRKSAILHKAFTGKLTEKWRRTHGIELDSWKSQLLSECCSISSGGTPSRKNSE